MDKFRFKKLQNILNIEIHSQDLYRRAFIHRSYLNETNIQDNSNERLEFLGDAVLQLLSSKFLFEKYKDSAEGLLTAYRSALVNTESLGKEAKRLGYGEFLLMSKGEEATGGRDREYILANTFEAVLGAIYLDIGIEECEVFLTKNLFYKIDSIIEAGSYKDTKSHFQEVSQELYSKTPTYTVLKEWGPDHDKQFQVGVFLGKKKIATGTGSSKQRAESNAAKKAIEVINNNQ